LYAWPLSPTSSEPDGKLRVKEGHLKGNQTVFTIDASTGVVQGDQVVPLGYIPWRTQGLADGAKLLRIDAARLQVIFVATNASRHPVSILAISNGTH
jgi:hypothetical protein